MTLLHWRRKINFYKRLNIIIHIVLSCLHIFFVWQTWIIANALREPFIYGLGRPINFVLDLLNLNLSLHPIFDVLFITLFIVVQLVLAGLLVHLLRLPKRKIRQQKNERLANIPNNGYSDMSYLDERPDSKNVGYIYYEINGNGRPLNSITEDDSTREAIKIALSITFLRGYEQVGDTLIFIGEPLKLKLWTTLFI